MSLFSCPRGRSALGGVRGVYAYVPSSHGNKHTPPAREGECDEIIVCVRRHLSSPSRVKNCDTEMAGVGMGTSFFVVVGGKSNTLSLDDSE